MTTVKTVTPTKQRIVIDNQGNQFAIEFNSDNEYITALSDTRFAIMRINSTTGAEAIVQVFNADVFKVVDCCNGTGDNSTCACSSGKSE